MIYKNRPAIDVKDPKDIAIEKDRGALILVQERPLRRQQAENKSVVRITCAKDVDRLIEALKCYRGSKFPGTKNVKPENEKAS